MADKTGIEWTDATWNPVTGCSKVSQGCKHCYAEREWPRLSALRQKPNIYTGRAFTDVACHPERLDQPLRWTKPRLIFVNSMSDLFHPDVPDGFIRDVFMLMGMAAQHHFQVLTKRPERMRQLLNDGEFESYVVGSWGDDGPDLDWPLPNVLLGVSVEDQAAADERIPLLLQTPAAVRWVSAEPLLGPVDLHRYMPDAWSGAARCDAPYGDTPPLDWVVGGGESGPKARPMHPAWVHSLRDQCVEAGVPFLFKQWGEWAPEWDGTGKKPEIGGWANNAQVMWRVGKKSAGRLLDGRTWDEYPRDAAC